MAGNILIRFRETPGRFLGSSSNPDNSVPGPPGNAPPRFSPLDVVVLPPGVVVNLPVKNLLRPHLGPTLRGSYALFTGLPFPRLLTAFLAAAPIPIPVLASPKLTSSGNTAPPGIPGPRVLVYKVVIKETANTKM